jgi:hypothetical protein
VTIAAGGKLHTANYADYEFFGTIGGAGDVVMGHPLETIGEPHTATWHGTAGHTGATTLVDGMTLVLDGSLTGTSLLTVDFATRINMTSGATKVIKAGSLNVTGQIDLKDNKLITGTPAGSATGGIYSGVQGLVQSGLAGGTWVGSGIITSEPDALNNMTTIGVATGAQILGLGPTDTALFAGQTINGQSTVAMYTYAGDLNLDGTINPDDYALISFNDPDPTATGYYNGDINYDGDINADDFAAIDFNFNNQGAPFPTGSALGDVRAVPEPSVCGLALLLALAGSRSRKRRRRDAL